MKTIEEIKEEIDGYDRTTLTFNHYDGSTETVHVKLNYRNAQIAVRALEAEATRDLLMKQLETATTPEEAAEVIRQALVAQAEYDKNSIEIITGIDPLTQTEIEEACDQHGLSYETLQEEADRRNDYKPLT